MHPRQPRYLPPPLAVLGTLLAVVLVSGCANFETGAPVAAVNVRAKSVFEVEGVLERIFTADGYRTSGRTFDSITFEKEGSRSDAIYYGNWIGGEVAQRARVAVAANGEGVYRIRCTPLIVRDPSDVAFEDEHRRMQLFSFHYSALLRKVKREFR